jgi:hypothetical protein
MESLINIGFGLLAGEMKKNPAMRPEDLIARASMDA